MIKLTSARHGATGDAVFSPCGAYRYLLIRQLSGSDSSGQSCLFVMLNPSTADAHRDDPTVRRCVQFAFDWGFDELRIVNLFALRTTNPQELVDSEDPVGPANDEVIRRELSMADRVVVAWGNRGLLHQRSRDVRKLLAKLEVGVRCLAVNATGEPVHPLYVRRDAGLSPWP